MYESRAGLLIKPGMFLSSYAPLFVMLAIRIDDAALRWVCVGLAGLGVLILCGYMILIPRLIANSTYRLETVSPAGAEATGNLASHLLPFVTVAQPRGRDLGAYVAFLVVAGVVYTRTAIIQVNPMLLLLGGKYFA